MNFYYQSKFSNNIIATIAIGKKHLSDWKKFALPTWLLYCKKNNISLVCFEKDLIAKTDLNWKKPTWQKLLIGQMLQKSRYVNVCYLDTDILINYINAPNIFQKYENSKIGLVSEIKNLPFDLEQTKRRLALLRNTFYNKKYPLDSSLFMSIKNLYKYHGFPNQNNYACAGLFVFNIKNHSQTLSKIFYKYTNKFKTITGGGDEPVVNYEILRLKKTYWFDYKFQALWMYEVSRNYPFLFSKNFSTKKLIKYCIENTLFENYFLHFAGSWPESQMWKQKGILFEKKVNFFKKLDNYYKKNIKGIPKKKQIKPNKL